MKVVISVAFLSIATLCMGKDPYKKEHWYASVKKMSLHEEPCAFSKEVAELKFGDELVIKKTFAVTCPNEDSFEGNPEWALVKFGKEEGYVPVSSIVSEWLFHNQISTFEKEETSSIFSAFKGFSDEEEDANIVAMKGAVDGKIQFDKANYGALATIEENVHCPDCTALCSTGNLSANGSLGWQICDTSRTKSKFKSAFGSVKKLSSKGLKKTKGFVPGANKASNALDTASNLLHNELGPCQQYKMGRTLAAYVLGARSTIDMNSALAQYVSSIGQIVARASNAPYQYNGYSFVVFKDQTPKAYSTPGGFVFISDGMLKTLKSEDQLAAILAHEISHIELNHGTSAVGQEDILKLMNFAREVAMYDQTKGAIDGLNQIDGNAIDPASLKKSGEAIGIAMAIALVEKVSIKMLANMQNGYSQELEAEADRRSIEICTALGYDSCAMLDILTNVENETGSCGGQAYPEERAELVKQVQHNVDALHAKTTNPIRTARYKEQIASLH